MDVTYEIVYITDDGQKRVDFIEVDSTIKRPRDMAIKMLRKQESLGEGRTVKDIYSARRIKFVDKHDQYKYINPFKRFKI